MWMDTGTDTADCNGSAMELPADFKLLRCEVLHRLSVTTQEIDEQTEREEGEDVGKRNMLQRVLGSYIPKLMNQLTQILQSLGQS